MVTQAWDSCDTPTSSTERTAVTLEKSARGRYRSLDHAKLRNNLLAGVGFLELANAGDFAANVWNEIPVPRHAIVLMAIGGPIALLVSLVVARDFYLSWQNLSLLYAERNGLQLGTEIIDRMLMDAFLGFGALLVGSGTIMAIWGADHRVFEVSNLLSGFVGNSCAAIYGVINACWSTYLVYRFQLRYDACLSDPTVGTQGIKIRRRFRSFQWHAGINGINGLVAGMASMVTARINLFWKTKLGYDRPIRMNFMENTPIGEKTGDDACCDMLDALSSVEAAKDRLQDIAQAGTLDTTITFVVDNNMFQPLCVWIARKWPGHQLFTGQQRTICVSFDDLKSASEDEMGRLTNECRNFLHRRATTLLEDRQRYMLELLGEILWTVE
ncbi:hypothetical protein BDV12DRAFT_190537 [Aspergillus spectabilis]